MRACIEFKLFTRLETGIMFTYCGLLVVGKIEVRVGLVLVNGGTDSLVGWYDWLAVLFIDEWCSARLKLVDQELLVETFVVYMKVVGNRWSFEYTFAWFHIQSSRFWIHGRYATPLHFHVTSGCRHVCRDAQLLHTCVYRYMIDSSKKITEISYILIDRHTQSMMKYVC